MQLRLSASGRTAQQPKSYCTKLPCSKAQARYLSQNIGIVTNCKTTHAKENYYSTGPGSFAHTACVHRPAHNMYIYTYIYVYIYIYGHPPPMDPPRALIFAKVPQIPIKPMLSGDFPVTGFLTVFLNSPSHTRTEGFSFCWLLFII